VRTLLVLEKAKAFLSPASRGRRERDAAEPQPEAPKIDGRVKSLLDRHQLP